MYVEAEISTGEDGQERLIDTLSLIDAVMPDVVSSRKQGPIKAEPGPADSPNVTAVEGVAGGGDQMDVDGTTEIPAEKSTVLKVVIVWLIVKILLPVVLDVILTQTV